MRAVLLAVVVLALCAVPAMAAGVDLPVTGGTAVWLQPFDATPGSAGAAISLLLPEKIVGETVAELIAFDIIVHPEGDAVRIDPGLSISLKTDLGVPIKVGLVLLPLTDYKFGGFVGMQIFQTF